MGFTLITADVSDALPELAEASFDACLCDPPYELGFMGKQWDGSGVAFQVPTWEAVSRVLKPGGFLLAFGGTRTHHRLMCAIEDAGFEIRDCVMYLYGSGFPKGHNWPVTLHDMACSWHGIMVPYDYEKTAQQKAEYGMRFVRASYLSQAIYACAECGQVLQPFMPEQGVSEHRQAWSKSATLWPEQPSMEGRGDVEAIEGELLRCEACTLTGRAVADGAEGWIHCRASNGDGTPPWAFTESDGSCPSYRPQSLEQLHRQPGALFIEWKAQASRGWNVSLKPAYEPCIVAMKPLDGTFAANAVKHGVAGINVDGCRIPGVKPQVTQGLNSDPSSFSVTSKRRTSGPPTEGRWPANVIHDGSEEVLEGFPEAAKSSAHARRNGEFKSVAKGRELPHISFGHDDSGSASRFFYCAKAGKKERGAGNTHPTVKPLALTEYLARLILPPERDTPRRLLVPFAGSGSEMMGAINAGWDEVVGIEREADYVAIAGKRLFDGLPLFVNDMVTV